MVILVTGEKGVGKSTICRKTIRIIQQEGFNCGGVLTFKSVGEDITIEDIQSGETRPFASVADHGSGGPSTPRYFFRPDGLDFGLQAIMGAAAADVVWIDEMGPLELRGEGFAPALELVKSGKVKKSVLVVRRELLFYYLPQLPATSQIFEVTVETRDDLPQQIAEFLLERLR
ncbi:nucleoside-triphosphatase [Chloroflexota bacterium]